MWTQPRQDGKGSTLTALQQRKQNLIEDLLKKKAAASKEFDDKLAQLGYQADGVKSKRSHHRKAAPAADSKAKA